MTEKGEKKEKSDYRAEDIYVLKGVEPVRKRPGMYIGSTGPEGLQRLLIETVSNAIDEAIMGYCDEIKVSLLPNNRIRVEDNGRGIPVETHPQTKKSALETVLTTLHAGAKFGGKVYASTGGLHGVGISAVCALSKYLRAEVCRDNNLYVQEYSRGKATTKLKKVGKCNKTGTTIIFEPDPEIFREIKFDFKKILDYLREQAFLTKKIKIIASDERTKDKKTYTFYFEGGILSYIKYLIGENIPRHPNIFYVFGEKDEILVETAFVYTQEMETVEKGFVNNIFTPEKGTHITGFRSALTRAFNDYAKRENLLKEIKTSLSGDDIREGLIAVVSVKLKEPQFEGQTKEKLGNPEAKTVVEQITYQGLIDYLERYPYDAKEIIKSCILAHKAKEAAKAARITVLRKGVLKGLTLPGKLTDCISRKPEESELFIVEGESAGGSARQARDRRFQAILPLKGKILNVERVRIDRVLSSEEIRALITALGTGIGDDFDINKIRYHKIIITVDADTDGNHIKTLLLTLFYRYFQEIIEKGYLYIAQPPLYKIQYGKLTKYCYNDLEKERFLKSLKDQKGVFVQRYKGLGEMNPQELWETTMNPENRVLLKVTIEDAEEADRIFDTLMGEEVEPRKKFIQIYAKEVRNLDI